jgi:hypothetical protein
MKNKISIISILAVATVLLSGCYTNRAAADRTSVADYNKRINIAGAHTVKRGNALNVTFQIGLIGAGAYGGYNMNLIQRQTENGREPVRAANAAVGAVAGAGLALLFDHIAGKNKNNYNIDPQKWIWKANNEYLLLDKSYGSYFTIIHPSAEQNYSVLNLQDVKDFNKAFPQSQYTESIIDKALLKFSYADIVSLYEIYPQYGEKIKERYLQQALKETNSFFEFKERIVQIPGTLPAVNWNIDYKNEEQIKDLFVQFEQYTAKLGSEKVRQFKNEILNELPVIYTALDKEYEEAEYNKIAENTIDYEALYRYASRFPNGTWSKSAKKKADSVKYASYSNDYERIRKELASMQDKIKNKQYIQVSTLEGYLTEFEKYGAYDPDNVKREIQSAQSFMSYANYYSAYTDIHREINGIIVNLINNQYPTSASLREKIKRFQQVCGSDIDNVTKYVDSALDFCVIMDGMTVPIPDSYRKFSLGGAAVGVIGAIVSGGNLGGMALAKPMDTNLAEEHQQIIQNAIDMLEYFAAKTELGETDFFFGTSYPKEVWRVVINRLANRDKALVQTFNKDVEDHNSMIETLDRWSFKSSDSSGSSDSNTSSKSSDEEIDPNRVSIPSYESKYGWFEDHNPLSVHDQVKSITFSDGVKGDIYYDEKPGEYCIDVTVWKGGIQYYKTEKDAINALYVWEKYKKVRTIGK